MRERERIIFINFGHAKPKRILKVGSFIMVLRGVMVPAPELPCKEGLGRGFQAVIWRLRV